MYCTINTHPHGYIIGIIVGIGIVGNYYMCIINLGRCHCAYFRRVISRCLPHTNPPKYEIKRVQRTTDE